jgi:hypothetical protein
MLQIPNPTQNATRLRGHNLAHSRRSKGQRAAAAAALILGEAVLVQPTILQAAAICEVSVTYAKLALKVAAARRAELAAGTVEIVELLPKRKSPSSLTEHLIASTADEKVEAAKALGVDLIWDQMILPLITTAAPAE